MSQGGILPRGFIERVKRIVGDEHFSQQESDLISYSLDYWLYGVFLSQKGDLPVLPSAVISPAYAAQIQEIVECAREYKVPITPFGGGSGVLGAAIPLNGSVILNLQRMSKFLKLDELSLVAEFEAGIMGANLELELNNRGYSAGNIPQSLYCSTLGGWISTRAAGQFSTKYGKIEDMVLGMEVVHDERAKAIIRTKIIPYTKNRDPSDIRNELLDSLDYSRVNHRIPPRSFCFSSYYWTRRRLFHDTTLRQQ